MTNENIRSFAQCLGAACAVFGGLHLISHLFPKPDPHDRKQRSTLRDRVSVYFDYIRPTATLRPVSSALIFTAGLAAAFAFSRKSAAVFEMPLNRADGAAAQLVEEETTLEVLEGQPLLDQIDNAEAVGRWLCMAGSNAGGVA